MFISHIFTVASDLVLLCLTKSLLVNVSIDGLKTFTALRHFKMFLYSPLKSCIDIGIISFEDIY